MEVVTEFVKEHVCVYNFTNERQPTIPCDASFDLVDVKYLSKACSRREWGDIDLWSVLENAFFLAK